RLFTPPAKSVTGQSPKNVKRRESVTLGTAAAEKEINRRICNKGKSTTFEAKNSIQEDPPRTSPSSSDSPSASPRLKTLRRVSKLSPLDQPSPYSPPRPGKLVTHRPSFTQSPSTNLLGAHPADLSPFSKWDEAASPFVAKPVPQRVVHRMRSMSNSNSGMIPLDANGIRKRRSTTSLYKYVDSMVVIKNYRAKLDDELDLRVGQTIIVETRFDDGWAFGHNESTGRQGVFPLQCAKALDDSVPAHFRAPRSRSPTHQRKSIDTPSFTAFPPSISSPPHHFSGLLEEGGSSSRATSVTSDGLGDLDALMENDVGNAAANWEDLDVWPPTRSRRTSKEDGGAFE
ncbi:hypothetical protein HDV05_007613, partial [Chytridiales sp. JEL 0842]